MICFKYMITIYTSPSCSSCKKVIDYFNKEEIPYVQKDIFSSVLKESELKDILIKSENGTDDIISKRSKIIKETKVDIEQLTISQLIRFIQENPSILKRPIIVDDHRIQVGYNEEDIGSFLPIAKKMALWACRMCPENKHCDHSNDDKDGD